MRRKLFITTALITGLGAGSALAQDLCGLPQDVVAWAGDGPLSSDIASASNPFDASIVVETEGSGTLAFVVSTASSIRLEAAATGDGDPIVQLLSNDGVVLGEDDDGGVGTSSMLEIDVEPGGYCLKATIYCPRRGQLNALCTGSGPARRR